jgi:hypothetical protein
LKSGTLHLLWIGLVLIFTGTTVASAEPDQEIKYLLSFVADSGCIFTRNGTAHDSPDAADHLRLKYREGKRYADSAEQFIDRLASESSWSGEPYTVDCDGRVETSSAWLHRALTDYRLADDPNRTGNTEVPPDGTKVN